MATTLHTPRAGILTRLAHWLGRMWARGERKAAEALVSVGLTQQAAKAVIWVVKLTVLVGIIFMAFWLALLVGVLFIVATGNHKNILEYAEPEPEKFEWRNGPEGDGLYCNSLGIRIDVPDEDQD